MNTSRVCIKRKQKHAQSFRYSLRYLFNLARVLVRFMLPLSNITVKLDSFFKKQLGRLKRKVQCFRFLAMFHHALINPLPNFVIF